MLGEPETDDPSFGRLLHVARALDRVLAWLCGVLIVSLEIGMVWTKQVPKVAPLVQRSRSSPMILMILGMLLAAVYNAWYKLSLYEHGFTCRTLWWGVESRYADLRGIDVCLNMQTQERKVIKVESKIPGLGAVIVNAMAENMKEVLQTEGKVVWFTDEKCKPLAEIHSDSIHVFPGTGESWTVPLEGAIDTESRSLPIEQCATFSRFLPGIVLIGSIQTGIPIAELEARYKSLSPKGSRDD